MTNPNDVSRALSKHPCFRYQSSSLVCPVEGCRAWFRHVEEMDAHLETHELDQAQAERWMSRRAYLRLAQAKGWKEKAQLADEVAMRVTVHMRGFADGANPARWDRSTDTSQKYYKDWAAGYAAGQQAYYAAMSGYEEKLRGGTR